MSSLQIMIILLTLFTIVFLVLLLSLFCETLRMEKKHFYAMCVFLILVLFHKMILKFPYMYVTYTILIILALITFIYDIIVLLKKKKTLQVLFIIFIFMFSFLFPTFGNLRQYYLYKPIFLLRSYSILENHDYSSFLSFMTGKNVSILKDKVYYELGQPFSFDNTGGIVITFTDAPSENDWDKYVSFEKIDNYAYSYTRHK